MSEEYYSDDDYDQEYAEGYSAYKYDNEDYDLGYEDGYADGYEDVEEEYVDDYRPSPCHARSCWCGIGTCSYKESCGQALATTSATK